VGYLISRLEFIFYIIMISLHENPTLIGRSRHMAQRC
jgi:hypothetical protein